MSQLLKEHTLSVDDSDSAEISQGFNDGVAGKSQVSRNSSAHFFGKDSNETITKVAQARFDQDSSDDLNYNKSDFHRQHLAARSTATRQDGEKTSSSNTTNWLQSHIRELEDSEGNSLDTSHDDSDLQPLEKKKQSTKAHNRNQIADDKKIVNQSNNSNYKRSIEIRNGIPMRSMNNLHKVSNAIGLHFYVGGFGVLWFIYDLVMQADHFILLINLALETNSNSDSFSEYSHIMATAIISILGTGLMNVLADNKLKEAADAVNNKPVERFVFFKKSRRFIVSNWADIQCGDIIKIKMNQEIPCDALILDIVGSKTGNQTCYTRGGLFDDDSNPSCKRSYMGTMNKSGQRISAAKFVDQINGLVKWEYNHQGYFSGSFKQENSPTAFDITPENIVQRGCYMQNATQAICLALNVGANTMGNQYQKDGQSKLKQFLNHRQKTNHFESVHFTALRYIQYFSICFCFVPCIFVVLQDLILKEINSSRFVQTFSDINTKFTLKSYTLILSGFLQNFPYLAKLTMEATIFFHCYYTMWDINLIPAQLNYTDLKIMKSMGQIDSIVCPKSAFLWHNTSFTVAFKINQKIYYNQNEKNMRIAKEDEAERNNEIDHMNQSNDSEEDEYERLDYLPNQIGFDPSFHNPNAQELIRDVNQDSVMFKELLLAMVLCHHATTNKKSQFSNDGYTRQTYKSLYKDEEAQLHFAHSFDYKFLKRKKRMVEIKKEGFNYRYDELLIRRIKVGDDFMTVSVVRPQQQINTGLTIYYRAPLKLLTKFLTLEEAKFCQKDNQMLKSEGIHAYGIAKHVVEPEDSLEFVRIINEDRGSKNLQSKNDRFLIKLARDLRFIGVFGLQVAFNYRDTLVIEDLRKNGIKLYMLSGEDTDNVQTDVNAMNLLEGFTDPINLMGVTERQVEDSLKSCLKEVLKRRLDERQKHEDVKEKNKTKSSKEIKRIKKNFQNARRKRQKQEDNKKRNLNLNVEYQAADVDKVKEANVLFFNGTQLKFILRDQTLEKLFLALCNLCSLCIGSSVTPIQRKFVVKAIRQFAVQGKLGNVISIISQQSDKFTIGEADITVGLIQNYKQSDVLARTDVQMKNLYGLTYLFFRHGTLAHRRAKIVLTEFISRTVTTQCIALFFFFVHGFSYILPYTRLFFSFFMAVQTPIQFWMQGISHTDYGYNVFHRIFGEYRFNLIQQVSIKDFFEVFLLSFMDVGIFMLCYLVAGAIDTDYQIDSRSGQAISWSSHIILNDVLLSIINIYRSRSIKSNVMLFFVSNYFFFLFSIITVLEDEYLGGFKALFSSGHALGAIFFTFLFCQVKQFCKLVVEITLPWNWRLEMRYKAIEDMIFMEEYENPEQQFSITSLESYAAVAKNLDANSVFSINQNLLIVHRSDSMDHILERLNITSSRMNEEQTNIYMTDNTSSFINRRNLKLHDINKEIEYNTNSQQQKQVEQIVPQLWTSVILFTSLLIYKVANSIIEIKQKERAGLVSTTSSVGSTAATSYQEALQVAISLSVIYSIKKIKQRRSHILVMTLICISNAMIVVKFYIDQESPLIQVQFLYTIAFSFGIRLNSFFYVSIVTLLSSIAFLQIRLSLIAQNANQESSTFQLSWMSFVTVSYVVLWIYYAYQDEVRRKVQFVTQYRRIKEFQKLKSIINILIPGIVRARLQDGKKIQPDQVSNATILWVEINEFDFLVQKYHGGDFTELLEKVYNGLENLCEQYGLQIIDTVGKTFVACGGLKFCEKNLDPRLLTSHQSVRVIEFAYKAQSFMSCITLRDGRKASISIGIHSGEIICGIVGDTKPQFSIIGTNVAKAAQICRLVRGNGILISMATYKATVNKVNNFIFEATVVTIDGKAKTFFTVQKRRGMNRRLAYQSNQKNHNKNQLGRGILADKKEAKLDSDGERWNEGAGNDIEASERTYHSYNSVQSDIMYDLRSERMIEQNESFNLDGSLNESYEDDEFNKHNFAEMKDDRAIVKIAATNDKYKLVERPRFLFSFETMTWENKFATSVFRKHFQTELCTFITKALFDLLLSQALVYAYYKNNRIEVNILVGLGVILWKVLDTMVLFMRKVKKPRGIMYQAFLFCTSFIFIVLLGPLVKNLVFRESLEATFAMYMMLAFLTRSFQFKNYAILIITLSLSFTFHNLFEVKEGIINMQNYVIESIMNIVFVFFLLSVIYNREMRSRKIYNSERIIEVEIRRTEELLNKLVPEHALVGIKNDQKVIDMIENVSVLYSNLDGFLEYYRLVQKPQEVMAFLNRIFSKFDVLCEQIGVQKVHILGDIYVVMGYSGKIAKEKRTIDDAITEAYNLIQVGIQMTEIVQEEKNRLKDPLLRGIDIKIGINTGKILGCIIGTKVARYDIFGQDVLISCLIQKDGPPGQVVVSEATKNMVAKRSFLYDTFYWPEFDEIRLKNRGYTVKTFICEQIFAENDSSDAFSEQQKYEAAMVQHGGGLTKEKGWHGQVESPKSQQFPEL